MQRILILEISGSGHHPGYLRRILQSGILREAHVTIAGPPSLLNHPELEAFRAQCAFQPLAILPREQARLIDFSTLGLVRREFVLRAVYGRTWRRISSSGPFDLVLLPLLDGCVNAIALRGSPFGPTPWIAISMRMQFHLRRMGVVAPPSSAQALRQALFHRLLKLPSLKALLTIDPTLADYAAGKSSAEFARVRYLPDTCNTYTLTAKAAARTQLGIPGNAKLILAYGALHQRKGIFHLIRAMVRPDCPKEVHLLLAGSQDSAVKDFLAGPAAASLLAEGRLHLLPGYVPEELVPALLSASDAMWIGYIDFYTMSNILVLAARHHLPCITSSQGIIGYLARKHQIGLTVDPRSEESVLKVLRTIVEQPPLLAGSVDRAYAAFVDHTDASFHRVFMDAVASALAASSAKH